METTVKQNKLVINFFNNIIRYVNDKKYLNASKLFDTLTIEQKTELFKINKKIIYLLENNKTVIETIINNCIQIEETINKIDNEKVSNNIIKNIKPILNLDVEKISFDINRIKNNLPPIL